jgi:hypothetical protein
VDQWPCGPIGEGSGKGSNLPFLSYERRRTCVDDIRVILDDVFKPMHHEHVSLLEWRKIAYYDDVLCHGYPMCPVVFFPCVKVIWGFKKDLCIDSWVPHVKPGGRL